MFRRTNRGDLAKHNQKLKKKNPVIVARRVFNNKGEHVTTEVDIKSRKLAEFMQELYDGVEGIDISRNPPWVSDSLLDRRRRKRTQSFQCNSKLFGHSAADLRGRLQQERASASPDDEFIEALEVALAFVEEDYGSSFLDADALLHGNASPSISFDLLWTLFRPGRLLYAYDEYTDQSRILKAQTYEIKWSQMKGTYAEIRAFMLTHDGRIFGRAIVLYEIPLFTGIRKLQDLAVYPVDFHPTQHELQQLALARGKKYVQMMQLKSTFHEIAEGPAVYEERKPDDWRLELRRFTVRTQISCLRCTGLKSFADIWSSYD